MHALFEEGGQFNVGRILSEAEASAQLELASGKRVKVKTAHLLLRFAEPKPEALLTEAQMLAASIELDLAWEFAPEDEFGFATLAQEYFSAQASLREQAAMLLALHGAPHYFRRAGKGRFRKANPEVLQQALAAIERKQQQQMQMDAWAAELAAGRCPQAIRDQLYRLLFKPDKNALEYKAVAQASKAAQLPVLLLLERAGAIDSSYDFHWQRFLFTHFPRGTAFPADRPASSAAASPDPEAWPLAPVQAVSIDDALTTEIDDALSIQNFDAATLILGIHIAAPALGVRPGDAVDQLARQRWSTVYMPGTKITMLPADVVAEWTLQEGRACPALSLYLHIDKERFQILRHETRVERVPIAANLRLDDLEPHLTPEALASAAAPAAMPATGPVSHAQWQWLWQFAQHCKAQREVVRGKPETFNRPDYNFRLLSPDGRPRPPGTPTSGVEQVAIEERQRGAPLDLIVAEAMILANSLWGQWLGELGVPAIYRSQASLLPGIKVRMGTKPLPHAGIGVPCYAWSTSPLRRYTDLVNQWQLLAAAEHGSTAALAAPFKPKDSQLLAILSGFDAAYTDYNQFQASMERYWTLRYVQQEGIEELPVSVVRPALGGQAPLVRALHLPLLMPLHGAPSDLARGAQLQVRLAALDLISLDVSAQYLRALDAAEAGPNASADDGGELDETAGPLTVAVDVDSTEPTESPQGAEAAAPVPSS